MMNRPSSAMRTPRSSVGGARPAAPANNRSKTPLTRLDRQTNFKVVIRVRPPLPRELEGDVPFQNIVAVDDREQVITVSENLDAVLDEDGQVKANPGPYSTHTFVFDYVYDQTSTQRKVYDTTARPVVDSALQGYNATIFAYGQTGTGKTYTMEGFNREGGIEARGIIPRAIEQIFGHIQKYASPRMRFLVRASYLQIYNEQISDLLKPERNNLQIREDQKRGVFVENLSEWVVRSPAEIYGLMERGGAIRATGETKMNEMSSRSHAVFIVIAEQSETVYVDDNGDPLTVEEFQRFMHSKGAHREQDVKNIDSYIRQSFKVGKLNLVDLAGSERVRLSGATGHRLKESQHINQSLAHLGNVMTALIEQHKYIPYRDSKLTRMLGDSLGGNCKTTMMAMISPAFEAMQETISTLTFANRAKNIKNEARVNEDLDQKSLLRKYERELKQLRAQLEERNRNVVDKRRLLELDEQRRRAEADKMTAIRALERTSLEFMHEKEEKKKLEQRIAALMGQVLRGDKVGPDGVPIHIEDHPEIHLMMKEQQEKLSKEYQHKLADLERERETIEEEKAQVDRYKQLLLKQRDIMIALTQRLVERDEQIMALQDELDAYDSHHRELEEKLDEKTAALIKLQRISMEVNASSPYKNEELNRALGESWVSQDGGRTQGATEVDLNSEGSPKPPSREDVSALLQSELDTVLRQIPNTPEAFTTKDTVRQVVAKVISRLDGTQQVSSGSRGSPADSAVVRVLKEENARLQAIVNAEQNSRSANSRQELQALQAKCESLTRDRDAVTSIMEDKIKVLSRNVAQSVSRVYSSNPSLGNSQEGQALSQDLAALQRMIGASIAALKNAAANAAKNGTPASISSNSSTGSASGAAAGVAGGAQRALPGGGGMGPASMVNGSRPPSAGASALASASLGRGAPANGAYSRSTPLPLPTYPGPASGSGLPPQNAAYSTPAQSGGAPGRGPLGPPMEAWGSRDDGYGNSDVSRSMERR